MTRPGHLVLWDVDHTLMESGHVGRAIFRAAFRAAAGVELIADAKVDGRTELAIFRDSLAEAGVPYSAAMAAEYAAHLTAGYERRRGELAVSGRAMPGAAEAIAGLASTGEVAQSVLTGNLRSVARAKLGAFGLLDHLDLELGAFGDDDEVRARLVSVAAARAAARFDGAFPAGAIVLVGDTPRDVDTALTNGARIVAVASGTHSESELAQAGATTVLPGLADAAAVKHAVLAELETAGS